MTKADEKRRQNYHYMAEGLRRLEEALHGRLQEAEVIPPEWEDIAQARYEGGKQRIALWVEADVLAFFRSMGKGHTTRMADVLKTFMHARLAGVVKGPEAVDYAPKVTAGERARARAKLDELRQRVREGREGEWTL